MAGREDDVAQALRDPSEVRRSRLDENAYLFYAIERAGAGCARLGGGLTATDSSLPAIQPMPENWGTDMGEVKVFYDRAESTLTVWCGDPKDESVCEETAEEIVLMKDAGGRVIGFEKLNFVVRQPDHLRVTFNDAAG
jgi:uncharacterized protein DUF2283